LLLVPGCEEGRVPHSIERLAGGSVNQTLLVQSRAGRFVVRSAGAGAARLGVDRRREAAFQSIAAAAGLAPRILAASTDARILVAEYVPGRTWSATDFGDRRALRRLAERLHALRGVAVPPALATPRFDPLAQIGQLARQVVRASAVDAALVESVVADAGRALAAGGGPREAVIVHLDLHPANIVEGERLVLLDWEYAACGDPALELASLLASDPRLEAALELLLAASALAPWVSRSEILALRRVFEATHWLWYRARRQHGAPPTAQEQAAERALLQRLTAAR
jgi:aminoglycoside phosphotransferase (APT) family kinase protein